MTCIVGLVKDGKVYMGADSAAVAYDTVVTRKDTKVFKNGEFLIGYTSSFRMGQLLRFSFSPPKLEEGQDLYEYMCTSFIDRVISVFKNNGYATISENELSGGSFLVGIRGRLFNIESDFQVGESTDNFSTCGCGMFVALGSLEILKDLDLTPETKIEMALKTAEKYSTGVVGPFSILNI